MITEINTQEYSGAPLGVPFADESMARVIRDYELMILSSLDAILRRCEAQPDYGFVDTKLNLVTGCDSPVDDPVRGRHTIYGWIQARALEALAGHDVWLRGCSYIEQSLKEELSVRIRTVLGRLVDRLEQLRDENRGRLFFMMSPQGEPLKLDAKGRVVPFDFPADAPANFSDLFYAKGLAAAASLFDDQAKLAEACSLFERVILDIESEAFVSDQQPLDPKNPASTRIVGRHSLGPRMIAIGGASVFLQSTGNLLYRDIGLRLIDYILQHHADLAGDTSGCQRYDVWEYVDDNQQPYVDEDGALLSDPGHVCEFVGLSLKFLRLCEALPGLSPAERSLFKPRQNALVEILKKNFANGFSAEGLGIGKAFDLFSRQMVNSDMPWWSLPETMRAALEACRISPHQQCGPLRDIAVKSSNAFSSGYVRPEVHLMAVQALNEKGQVSPAIPATPDADPAYHTGLSMIDCLDLYGEEAVCTGAYAQFGHCRWIRGG